MFFAKLNKKTKEIQFFYKKMRPTASVKRIKWNFVELRGVEPRSEHETTMLSTCLVACWFS